MKIGIKENSFSGDSNDHLQLSNWSKPPPKLHTKQSVVIGRVSVV